MIPKFRAWDDNGKRYEGSEVCLIGELVIKSSYSATRWEEEAQLFNLCQYTGLKDTNGVEIYEGDILSFTTEQYHSGVFIEENHIGEIEFCDGAYLLKGYLLFEILSDDYESKIIGNIHQNPELLEVTE